MGTNVEVEALAELVQLKTVSADADSQTRALQMVQSMIGARPGTLSVTEVGGAQPFALLANDAAPSHERLLFACHVDTVPVPDPTRWEFAPWSGAVAGGRLHGRGASDMKAGVIASVGAFRHAIDTGVPAALLLTSDEEIGSLGAAAAAALIASLGTAIGEALDSMGNQDAATIRRARGDKFLAMGRA